LHVYLVRPGDTLAKIATHYHVTPEELIQSNDLPSSPFLLPGQSIVIPSRLTVDDRDRYSTYQVQSGDTLRNLSIRFRIPVTWLAFCNTLEEGILRSGDVLLVPHTSEWKRQTTPVIGLLSVDSDRLRIDASGLVHLPELAPHRLAKATLLCTLDGPAGVLPYVAKAILRSESAQQQIFDGLASRLCAHGVRGIVFDWQTVSPDCQAAYLAFVNETGRRLRPMGLEVGLHIPATSPWQKKLAQVGAIASSLDHLLYEPSPAPRQGHSLYATPPAPLTGVDELQRHLLLLTESIPARKIWLVNRSLGVVCKQGQVLELLSPHQALQLAYHQGAPLNRETHSELAWFRTREGGCTVWFEDLWSLVRKIELLNQMNLQGLAMWESGGYFPEAWSYVHEYFERSADSDEPIK